VFLIFRAIHQKSELNFNFYGSVHRKNILMYVQQDARLHSLFYLETAVHVSGGIITHHWELRYLFTSCNTSGDVNPDENDLWLGRIFEF